MARTYQFRQLQFRDIGWRGYAGLAVAVALAIAVAAAVVVLSIGLALVLLPIVAVAMVYARWRLGRLQRAARGEAPPGDDRRRSGVRIIETDYAIIDRADDSDRR